MQGRPGPVVIALPEDMLLETAEVADAPRVEAVADLARAHADGRTAEDAVGGRAADRHPRRRGLDRARRARPSRASPSGSTCRSSARSAARAPSTASIANYAGEIGLVGQSEAQGADRERRSRHAGRRRACRRRPRRATTLFGIPAPRQRLVHVHADALRDRPQLSSDARDHRDVAGVLRRAGRRPAAADDPLVGRDAPGARRLSRLERAGAGQSRPRAGRRDHVRAAPARSRTRSSPPAPAISPSGSAASCASAASSSSSDRPPARWALALPAAIAAARVYPERTVVCFAGDGDFLMNGQEFATAVQYGLPIVVVLIDNGIYGTIRMHQEREFPGRVIASSLRNPDFAAYARAFGGHGETVEETAEFVPAFERALASGLPSIVHVKIDPEAITPATDAERDPRERAGEKRDLNRSANPGAFRAIQGYAAPFAGDRNACVAARQGPRPDRPDRTRTLPNPGAFRAIQRLRARFPGEWGQRELRAAGWRLPTGTRRRQALWAGATRRGPGRPMREFGRSGPVAACTPNCSSLSIIRGSIAQADPFVHTLFHDRGGPAAARGPARR